MSLNNPDGGVVEANQLQISGIADGIVSIESGILQSTTLGSNLLYSDPILSLNPTITGLTSLTSTTVNSDNLDAIDANLDTAHITNCYVSGLLNPVGSVDVGASLSRFNNGHFAGTVSATSYNGTLLTAAQPNITSLGTLGSLTVSGALSLGTALSIANGGTGATTASAARTALGLGTAAIMAGPSGAIVGTTDTQALTNKTLTDSTNSITANGLRSASTTVSVSGATAPTSGQVLTATSSTAATWQTPAATLTGTTNRITVSAGAIDIASTYVGQTSITTLGSLTALNMAGNILPTTSFTRNIGSTTLKFEDIFANQINLYNNVNTGTTLTNQININGPAWATSLNYGISIGCPYSATSPYHTAQESKINQFSTSGGSFGVAIGNVERNTAGTTTADYSKNILAAYGKLGINHPATSVPGFTIDAYGLDSSLVRISNSSSQDCLRLTQSGTNTILAVNSTLAGANNAYFDMCANTPNTPTARLQAFNSSTTTAGLLRFSVQNNTGVLTGLYDMDFVRLKPVSNNALDLGQTSLIWRDIYAARLLNDTANLALGCNSATVFNMNSTSLAPTTDLTHSLGSSTNRLLSTYSRDIYGSNILRLGVSNTPYIQFNGGNFYPLTTSQDLGADGGNWRTVFCEEITNTTYSTNALLSFTSTTRGVLLPRMTTAQATAISSPDANLIVHNTDSGRLSSYSQNAWRNYAWGKNITAWTASTSWNTTSSGTDLGGFSMTVVAPPSGVVEVGIMGGNWYDSVSGVAYFMGWSTTSGAQVYTSWNWGYSVRSDGLNQNSLINLKWVKDGLTPGTSYTIYSKFGRITSGTNTVISGSTNGDYPRIYSYWQPL